MANTDFIVKIVTSLGKGLGESASLFSDFSTDEWGVQLPPGIFQSPSVNAALQQAGEAASKIQTASEALEAAVQANDKPKIIQSVLEIALELKSFTDGMNNLVQAIKSEITAASIPDATSRALALSFIEAFSKKLLDNIIISAIENYSTRIMYVLKLLGLADWKFQQAEENNELFDGYVRKKLQLEKIKSLISDPGTHFQNITGWGTPSFSPAEFFQIYTEFFDVEDSIFTAEENGVPFLQRGDFIVRKLIAANPGLQFEFFQSFNQSEVKRFKISDDWGVNLSAKFGLSGKVLLNITPPFDIELIPPSGEVSGELKGFIDLNEDKRPFSIIGASNDLVQLTADNLSAGIGVNASWDSANGKAVIDPLIFAEIKKASLKLGTSDADSFIGKILSNANIESSFDFGLEWLFNSGLRIKASGGIEIALPIHQQLGIIEIDTIFLALKILESGTLSFEASAAFKSSLGPLTVVVERLGVKSDLNFKDSTDKFGLFDFGFGFKPPNGLGLSVNAGAVSGGGYLFFDFEKQEYAGVLELTIAGFISAKAIGLITTKMPDGSKGFSMLLIITAEFFPPFQLSYGFTLIALGGLLGLNRTVLLDPLREGVRTGAVNSIMFPQNVVANAARIISDLKLIFPPYENKFLIGPMAKMGWGTPTLISLSLGLIIEIPGNLAILGILKIALPEESIAIIQIQVLFVGTIDFDKKMITFDASLYESRILVMTLEGDMAVRLKWGDGPDFILTVGGFHPSYIPPPLALPSLRRIAINILDVELARIRVECYQAVTSNTVQFGARCELFFGFSAISISGNMGFDALFQFSPFCFIIEASGKISLKIFGMGVFSITLRFTLEGPTPFRAKGRGSISFFFFDVSADFDMTWGESKNTSLPDIEIFPRFILEISKGEQWSTVLSSNKNLLVSLRKISEASQTLVLHPAGSLVVQQKLLPIFVQFDKIGNQKTSDVKKISITSATSAGVPLTLTNVDEDFARAQYQNLSDADKLSKPSFEKMPGGVMISMGANSINNGKMARRKIEYEITIIDKEPKKPFEFGQYYVESGILFSNSLKGNSASKSVLSKNYHEKLQPFEEKMNTTKENYAVAFSSNNKSFNEASTFDNEAMAQDYMKEQINLNPSLKKELHIIPNYELN